MHKMIIQSPQDDAGDTFGQVILVNGINDEQYIFDVMKDEELDLEEGELYQSVFLSAVVPGLDLQDREAVIEQVFIAQPQLGLDDLLNPVEFRKVFQKIVEFEREGKPFAHEVPLVEQQLHLHSLIIDEEITRLVFLVLDDALMKKDVIDFGRLLCLSELLFEIPQLDYLEEPFLCVLSDKGVSEKDLIYIEAAMDVVRRGFKKGVAR